MVLSSLFAEADDYVASNGIVNIEPGDIKDCIDIGISDDNDQEPSEDFEVIFTLENIPSLHVVATVTIIDDEEKGTYVLRNCSLTDTNHAVPFCADLQIIIFKSLSC